MSDPVLETHHFTKAVTELGEKRPVLTTEAIFNDSGVKVLDKGVAINAKLYERLIAHKLPKPIEESLASSPEVTGAVLRQHAEDAMRDVPFFARIAEDTADAGQLLDTLESLVLPDAMAFQLLLALEVRPGLFRHSVWMAMFATWMTMGPMVSRYDLGLAASAGLLHDIGMQHLDPLLLQPSEALSAEQRRQLYSHPLVSKVLLERHHAYPVDLLRAVQDHHEFLDGSGYPRSLQGEAIGRLARILSLGELVTSRLESDRGAKELHLAVQLRMNRHRYDVTLVARLERHLRPETDIVEADVEAYEDPVAQLLAIHATVLDWPATYLMGLELTAARLEGMQAVAAQANQLRRTLATAGVADVQLAQLGPEKLDAPLRLELSLLGQEAAWQLRALARQTKRRWRMGTNMDYPAPLQAWLDRADALATQA
jgi:hypothetical protein